jgi:hypothetical protein
MCGQKNSLPPKALIAAHEEAAQAQEQVCAIFRHAKPESFEVGDSSGTVPRHEWNTGVPHTAEMVSNNLIIQHNNETAVRKKGELAERTRWIPSAAAELRSKTGTARMKATYTRHGGAGSIAMMMS